MGASYQSTAVIGCEVTGKLHRNVEVQRCTCPAPAKIGRFCSNCGASNDPLLRREPLPFYDEDNHRIGTLHVVFTTDEQRAFAGITVSVWADSQNDGGANHNRMLPSDLGEISQRIKDCLQSHGLWNSELFGLWAVSYVSY